MTDLHKKSCAAAMQSFTINRLGGQNYPNQTHPSTPDDLRNAESSAIDEEKERQKHGLKHNITKYNADQSQTHKQQNIVSLQDKLSSYFNIRAHMSNATRLGNKGGLKPTL